mgnify:CR=1 FL=1
MSVSSDHIVLCPLVCGSFCLNDVHTNTTQICLLVALIAGAGGIGGGVLFVPVLAVVGGFLAKDAAAISNVNTLSSISLVTEGVVRQTRWHHLSCRVMSCRLLLQ